MSVCPTNIKENILENAIKKHSNDENKITLLSELCEPEHLKRIIHDELIDYAKTPDKKIPALFKIKKTSIDIIYEVANELIAENKIDAYKKLINKFPKAKKEIYKTALSDYVNSDKEISPTIQELANLDSAVELMIDIAKEKNPDKLNKLINADPENSEELFQSFIKNELVNPNYIYEAATALLSENNTEKFNLLINNLNDETKDEIYEIALDNFAENKIDIPEEIKEFAKIDSFIKLMKKYIVDEKAENQLTLLNRCDNKNLKTVINATVVKDSHLTPEEKGKIILSFIENRIKKLPLEKEDTLKIFTELINESKLDGVYKMALDSYVDKNNDSLLELAKLAPKEYFIEKTTSLTTAENK